MRYFVLKAGFGSNFYTPLASDRGGGHHRKLGFKSKEGGLARAKAGVMRRLSMTALRSTARHVLRGLAIVGPSCIHQRNAREAARRAHLDAFGANRGAPWRDPTNGG